MQYQEPSADGILLLYLSLIVGVLLAFASGMYWAMKPLPLQNTGMAEFEKPMRKMILVPDLPTRVLEAEQLALEAAERENGRTVRSPEASSRTAVATNPPKKQVAPPRRGPKQINGQPLAPRGDSNPFRALQSLFR